KGTTVEERHHNLNNPNSFEARREADQAFFEKKTEEYERWLERKRLDEEFWAKKKPFEERLRQEDVASREAERSAADAENSHIASMPFVMGGALAWMGLSGEAVEATGKAM